MLTRNTSSLILDDIITPGTPPAGGCKRANYARTQPPHIVTSLL